MSTMPSMYQAKNALAARRAECERLEAKYPTMVPLVLERADGASDKTHFAALPRSATVAELDAAVRDAAGVTDNKVQVSLAVGGCAPSAAATVGDLFDCCKDADGFLYVCFGVQQKMGTSIFALPCITRYSDN